MANNLSYRITDFILNNRKADLYIYVFVFAAPILTCFMLRGHYVYIWDVMKGIYGFGKSSFMLLDKVSINNMGVMLLMLFSMVKISLYGIKIAKINHNVVERNKGNKYANTDLFRSNARVWAVFSLTIFLMCINFYLGYWPLLYLAFFALSKTIGDSLNNYEMHINRLAEPSIPIVQVGEKLGKMTRMDDEDALYELKKLNRKIRMNSKAICEYTRQLTDENRD